MQGQAPACPQRCPSGRAEAPGSRAAAGRRAAMLCTLDAGGARPQAARSSQRPTGPTATALDKHRGTPPPALIGPIGDRVTEVSGRLVWTYRFAGLIASVLVVCGRGGSRIGCRPRVGSGGVCFPAAHLSRTDSTEAWVRQP